MNIMLKKVKKQQQAKKLITTKYIYIYGYTQ